ncbi:uncharacterized protein LOC125241523 isoform X2 [Leguminivora glycinivorella]|uniref:uncharacterized protein LOC125241523 isoform X2 n=1 Tax=Leguminivora glycinivorella TaxID=1035111 RepID=UPI00200D07EE|nr:uncharacterized protein LOC125241523 isoform X2 [Leguminivora glycinivorella]
MERKWVDRVELVGSCYRLMVEWKGGWPEVRDWCNREGGQLLVIDNEVEHDIICELIGNQEKMFWLGFWHWRDWLLVNQNEETLHEVGYQKWSPLQEYDGWYWWYRGLVLKPDDCMPSTWYYYGICEKHISLSKIPM